MDFARKQLEKFGWKDGTGLGKDNQGRVEAIKPALKVGKEGMGYDFSKELTDTWWTRAYDDSLKRINVDEESETVGVTLQEDDDDDSTKGKTEAEERPFQKMRKRMMKATFTTFSKGATLSNGEMLAEPKSESDSESDEQCEKKSKELNKLTLTDEELLKACGGRTAHKAARFGLKLNGKLARIAAQEAAALAHLTKNSSKTVDQYSKISNAEDTPENTKEKKKRKKKRSIPETDLQGTSVPVQIPESEEIIAVTNETNDEPPKKKKKQKKKKNGKLENAATVTEENADVVTVSELAETMHRKKSKKSKKRKNGDDEEKLLSD